MALTSGQPIRVSVIIPTRERSPFLAEALASVRALAGPDLDLEIIVVENDSAAQHGSLAASFNAQLLTEETPGAAAARNAGLRHATGEFVAFLDDDDVWLASHLRPHLALLQARPDFAAVIGQVVSCSPDLTVRGEPWPRSLPQDGQLQHAFLTLMPQIGATVIRATALDQVGFLDESLLSDEDWDWHLRLAASCKVGFVPTDSVLFRRREVGTEDDLLWLRHQYFRRVFWLNARRASRTVSLAAIVRAFVQHEGEFVYRFLTSARAHVEAHDGVSARRAIRQALACSTPHVLKALLTNAELRRTLGSAARGAETADPLPPTARSASVQ